jgi:hypothetical protein
VQSPIRQSEGQTIQSDFPDDHAETSRAAGVLLNPKRRRFVLWPLIVGGLAGLIIAAALKMGPPWVPGPPVVQDWVSPPPKIQDAMPTENVKPPEPLQSLVLDTAQSYLATGNLAKRK